MGQTIHPSLGCVFDQDQSAGLFAGRGILIASHPDAGNWQVILGNEADIANFALKDMHIGVATRRFYPTRGLRQSSCARTKGVTQGALYRP
jgi:hypothetical protein